MSGDLIKCIVANEGDEETETQWLDGDSEPPAPPERVTRVQHPPNIEELLCELGEWRLAPYVEIGRVDYAVHFTLPLGKVERRFATQRARQCSVERAYSNKQHQALFESNYRRAPPAHVLEVARFGFDMNDMPFDLQVSIGGLDNARRGFEMTPVLRDDVLPARDCVPRLADAPLGLLQNSLVMDDARSGATYKTIEAIGFEASAFWRSVAMPVTEPAMLQACAALYCESAGALSAKSPTPLARSPLAHNEASSQACNGAEFVLAPYYRVPLANRFTDLLIRVHKHVSAPDKQARTPRSPVAVPVGSRYATFRGTDLQRAVKYVERELAHAHAVLRPANVQFTAAPYEYEAWHTAVDEHRSVRSAFDSAAPRRRTARQPPMRDLHFSAFYSIYYLMWKGGDGRLPMSIDERLFLDEQSNLLESESDQKDADATVSSVWRTPRSGTGTRPTASSAANSDDDESGSEAQSIGSITELDDEEPPAEKSSAEEAPQEPERREKETQAQEEPTKEHGPAEEGEAEEQKEADDESELEVSPLRRQASSADSATIDDQVAVSAPANLTNAQWIDFERKQREPKAEAEPQEEEAPNEHAEPLFDLDL